MLIYMNETNLVTLFHNNNFIYYSFKQQPLNQDIDLENRGIFYCIMISSIVKDV